jgi:hypothetical protein
VPGERWHAPVYISVLGGRFHFRKDALILIPPGQRVYVSAAGGTRQGWFRPHVGGSSVRDSGAQGRNCTDHHTRVNSAFSGLFLVCSPVRETWPDPPDLGVGVCLAGSWLLAVAD